MGAIIVLLVSAGLFIWALERNHRRNAWRLRSGSGMGASDVFAGDYGGPWTHR